MLNQNKVLLALDLEYSISDWLFFGFETNTILLRYVDQINDGKHIDL